ncbi:hypothetical protein AGOR_G00214540 [Albula goreensis]|uniref:Phosphoinositide phospholipase C n=1 Tax=Albula goreensis TaxID=1534307 RepID=A0A8T3CLP6_9TELE|nr:hypothetical protein AGOR_G00214540 [Albula goreensis]
MASTKNNFSIQGDDSLQFMTVGSMMRKVKSQTRKKQLYIQLQEDGMNICEQSKKDGKVQSTFSVSDVESVREGHQSEVLQSVAEEFPAEHCFTLVFHGRRGNLDLVAESAGEAQCWIKGLRKLIERLESMGHKEKLDHWIKDLFRKADKNKDGRMNFKEVRDLLKMMNIDMNELHALHLFMMADKSASDTLEDDEFVLFYKMLTDRDDVLQLFRKYSGDGHKLTLCNLEDFLQKEQLETEISRQRILELVNKYEPSETAKRLQAMSIDGFLLYLSSADGMIFNPCQQRIYQDMTQPLCHYFISSSHNTYLLQDQLIGHSSVEGYIRALKRGCRCVELDCWDGSNGEPVVYHGHTFTSKILFKDVIIAVEKYAFTTSKYPVILSIENHCSVEQQRVMAQYLDEILGDKLLKVLLDGKIPDRLPSPQELIGKILIKGKKIGNHSGVAEDSLACEVSDEEEIADNDDESTHHSSKKPKRHLSRQLSDCVVYCKTVPFTSFDNSRLHSKFYEMSSFSESKARKLIRAAEFTLGAFEQTHPTYIPRTCGMWDVNWLL